MHILDYKSLFNGILVNINFIDWMLSNQQRGSNSTSEAQSLHSVAAAPASTRKSPAVGAAELSETGWVQGFDQIGGRRVRLLMRR